MAIVKQEEGARQLTEREQVLLKWLAACRLATIRQVQRKAGLNTVWAAYQCMQQLQRAGYVSHTWVLRGQPGVYRVTRLGLRAIGWSISPAPVDVRTLRRDLILVDLALDYEEAGWVPIFERCMRWARKQGKGADYGVFLLGSSRPHFAPLFLLPANGLQPPCAVEIQLANQGHPRRRRLLAAYAATPYRLDYWVPARTVPAVQEDVEALGLADRVTVRAVEEASEAAHSSQRVLVGASS